MLEAALRRGRGSVVARAEGDGCGGVQGRGKGLGASWWESREERRRSWCACTRCGGGNGGGCWWLRAGMENGGSKRWGRGFWLGFGRRDERAEESGGGERDGRGMVGAEGGEEEEEMVSGDEMRAEERKIRVWCVARRVVFFHS
jgi:hypothetical protein